MEKLRVVGSTLCWVTLLAPPMSTHRPGVVPFSQTVTDCQPFGVSQEAELVSAICQVVLSPTNAVFLPWDGAEERGGAPERSCHLFFPLSLSLSSVTKARESIFPSGYSAGEGCPGERRICLESVTQAKQRQLPRGRMNSFMPLTPRYRQPSCLGPTCYSQTHTYVHIHRCLCESPRGNRWHWGRNSETGLLCFVYVKWQNPNSFPESKSHWLTAPQHNKTYFTRDAVQVFFPNSNKSVILVLAQKQTYSTSSVVRFLKKWLFLSS